jgi:hypothetical protein
MHVTVYITVNIFSEHNRIHCILLSLRISVRSHSHHVTARSPLLVASSEYLPCVKPSEVLKLKMLNFKNNLHVCTLRCRNYKYLCSTAIYEQTQHDS